MRSKKTTVGQFNPAHRTRNRTGYERTKNSHGYRFSIYAFYRAERIEATLHIGTARTAKLFGGIVIVANSFYKATAYNIW